jgi:hypothetical protein
MRVAYAHVNFRRRLRESTRTPLPRFSTLLFVAHGMLAEYKVSLAMHHTAHAQFRCHSCGVRTPSSEKERTQMFLWTLG